MQATQRLIETQHSIFLGALATVRVVDNAISARSFECVMDLQQIVAGGSSEISVTKGKNAALLFAGVLLL